jgi:phosphoribosylaminoimidazole-succinocarboxamide synthase
MATHVLERRGSSKDIWKTLGDKGEVTGVHFIFSDRVSVFDVGPLPVQFPGESFRH